VIRHGIRGKLRRTLESTNPCESMIDSVETTQRNVKHWSSGEMGLRWTAAGMLEAERQFRNWFDIATVALRSPPHASRRRPRALDTGARAVSIAEP
jgi:hypothetical protein